MPTPITYNQLIKVLKDFAASHLQLHDFGVGDFWELTSRDENGLDSSDPKTYPLMWCFPLPSPITDKVDNLTMSIAFMDLVNNGEGNEEEVHSDMREVIKDLIAHLMNNPIYSFTLEDTVTTEPFTERFDDTVTGWVATFTLRQPFVQDRCAIPFDPVPSGTGDASVKILDSEGNVIETVSCGGSYTLQQTIKGFWDASQTDTPQITIDSDTEGIYATLTDDGSSGTVTLEKNGSPIISFPVTLSSGDTLDANRTVSTGSGFYKLTT